MTPRHTVTVAWWNVHAWHFAQQNLLMEKMMNSPWWEKNTDLPESSRKEYYFVPLEAFRSSKTMAQGHAFPFLREPQDRRPRPGAVCQCPGVCNQLHLSVAQFLPNLEMHAFCSLPWRGETSKLRITTITPCAFLAGSCSGTHVFRSIHHMQQDLTWPPLPQKLNLSRFSLLVSALILISTPEQHIF